MTNSLTRGRAENAKVPQALAYYQRLERESKLLFHVSPFKPGRAPVPLHFDFSYDYYPTAYYRPGGIVDIYQLNNCVQGFGRVQAAPVRLQGAAEGRRLGVPAEELDHLHVHVALHHRERALGEVLEDVCDGVGVDGDFESAHVGVEGRVEDALLGHLAGQDDVPDVV